ncbi:MAG: glycosyltransferase family 39 protein [Syntrophobacterales bacterium]|nr:MAG: glycosyltransferase family 39 protein [Syntrophobacterales bacterium]
MVIFVVGILLLLPCIWSEMSVTGQDEYLLSLRTPMETLERGSWFVPWVNGEPRLKKPPLVYWVILLSYKLFGINLIAARLVGVLSGAGLALCSCLLYRELFKKSGMLAGLITLATVAVAIEGRRAMLDLPLAFFTSMAVYFALRWGKSGRLDWILLSAFSLGLSFLVKGPVGFIFFGAAAITALFVFRKWRFAFSHWSQIVWALVLLLAVCAPWPLIMAHLWPNFLSVVGGEIAARRFGNIRVGSPLSTVGAALLLVFPWSVVLIAAVVRSVYYAQQTPARKNLWLVAWFLGSIIPFFFMKSFERYLMPIIPAASVLCANWLDEVEGILKTSLLRISITLIALVAVFFCLAFIWFAHGLPITLMCLFFVGLMFWVTFARGDTHMAVGAVAVLLALIMGGLYPFMGINAMPRDLEKIVGHSPVVAYNSPQPSMLSIRLKRSVVRIHKKDIHLLKHFDGFVFMREIDAEGFEALARELDIHYEKTGQFKTFYARKTWVRFAREDATLDDWKKAIKMRSMEDLQPSIYYYRVYPKIHPDE